MGVLEEGNKASGNSQARHKTTALPCCLHPAPAHAEVECPCTWRFHCNVTADAFCHCSLTSIRETFPKSRLCKGPLPLLVVGNEFSAKTRSFVQTRRMAHESARAGGKASALVLKPSIYMVNFKCLQHFGNPLVAQ